MPESLLVGRNVVSGICKLKPKNLKKPKFLPVLQHAYACRARYCFGKSVRLSVKLFPLLVQAWLYSFFRALSLLQYSKGWEIFAIFDRNCRLSRKR